MISVAEITAQFADAMRAHGIEPPKEIVGDSTLRRFSTNDKRSDDAGWYVLHANGIPAGIFGDWRSGIEQTWRADIGRELTRDEQAAHRAKLAEIQRQREVEEAERHARAAQFARTILKQAKPADDSHPYLVRKGVKALPGMKVGRWEQRGKDDCLLIPLHDADGKLWNVQAIFPEEDSELGRDKDLLKGARKLACYFSVGTPKGILCIVEGYADCAAVHQATDYAVAAAMDAHNLEHVARAVRPKLPHECMVMCADNDIKPGEANTGIEAATKAALAVGGLLAIPELDGKKCDFNDLFRERGPEAVRAALMNARAPNERGPEWPDPQPLRDESHHPYPLDALPADIQAAVREVLDFVQCPPALAACSALSASSMAAQALADVCRDAKLEGPISLYMLTVAESGERKTTCDDFFASGIREWECTQAKAKETELGEQRAKLAAWEAKRRGVLAAIERATKSGKATHDEETRLRELDQNKPRLPRVPRLCYLDSTPEALAYELHRGWHSGGVLSSEAGIVFGARGMNRDSIMRNLGLLNVLWERGIVPVDRRTAESFKLAGARLTLGLAVQPETVREFFEGSHGLARGTGFAARFLISRPESTQGERPFKPAPASWPKLGAFSMRIRELLDLEPTMNEGGELTPPLLDLSPEAKKSWIEFHDEVERELKPSGDMADTRDVASKAADNVARLAALFHVYAHGPTGQIGQSHLESAIKIVTWHLYEARRFLGELALPKRLANAARLDKWLLDYCREHTKAIMPTREVQQRGPNSVRDRRVLDEALQELVDAGRVRLEQRGRQRLVAVNPALLGGGNGAS